MLATASALQKIEKEKQTGESVSLRLKKRGQERDDNRGEMTAKKQKTRKQREKSTGYRAKKEIHTIRKL